MKAWILSFLCFINIQLLFACGGWYPFGESVRFTLLDPKLYDDGGMQPFYYSSDFIHSFYEHSASNDKNVDDWFHIAQEKVSKDEVFDAVYRLRAEDMLDKSSTHPFVLQLRKQGADAELKYLSFAKTYSYLNTAWGDPWEREDMDMSRRREKAIIAALKHAKKVSEPQLKRRYAFQALRFAYYNGNEQQLKSIYEQYFSGKQELIIDQWAMCYYIQYEESSAERNFKLAQLFVALPSKRFGIFNRYEWDIPLKDVLAFAKTDQERANVLAMRSVRRQERSLTEIEEIYNLDPSNSLLPYLIVRETNKIEDWILGPNYTTFAPVMRPGVNSYSSDWKLIADAMVDDMAYAGEFTSWLRNHQRILDFETYKSVTGMLLFCTADYRDAEKELAHPFENETRENWRQHMLGVLKIANGGKLNDLDLNLFLNQDYEFKERFLFLVGRLFEYRKDLSTAALFFSQLNRNEEEWLHFTWAESRGISTFNVSFYSDYFDYFDANYTGADLREILHYAEGLNVVGAKPEIQQLTSIILADQFRLKDLIGTKFFREGQLEQSINWLKQVPDTYWKSHEQSYAHYLAANPFYVNFYSEHAKTEGDTVSYTKLEIAEKLSALLKAAQNQSGNKQAKTYFHIANCYFNMTSYGNSWMMRRSWWSANVYNTVYVDNDEFNKCIKAKEYYLKAYESANSQEYKALCLRMAGRCESYRFNFEHEYDYDFDYDKYGGYSEYMFNKNDCYKRLKKEFPQYERDLITNCHSFKRFYRSI